MDLGTLHLLVNLHHLGDGSVDLHQIIQRNLRAQKVPHSQGQEVSKVKSLPMSPATVRGLKRWIAAKKTEDQGSKKFYKSETRSSRIKSLLPVLAESKQVPSAPDRLPQHFCSLARIASLPIENQSSDVTQSTSADLHHHSNLSSSNLSEPVISDKTGEQIVDKTHCHGIHDLPSHICSQEQEEFRESESENKDDIYPVREAQWNTSLESKSRGKNVIKGNQSKHIHVSEEYQHNPKHSRHKDSNPESKLAQYFDAQDSFIPSEHSSFSNDKMHANKEYLCENIGIRHDESTLFRTQRDTCSTSHTDFNSFSKTTYSSGDLNTNRSLTNCNEEFHHYRNLKTSEYHWRFTEKPKINHVECLESDLAFRNLPVHQNEVALSHGLSDDDRNTHVSSTWDTGISMHSSGVDISKNQINFPEQDNTVPVTAKTCYWKLPDWLLERPKTKEVVGHDINSPDFLTSQDSQQFLPVEREWSIDTCEMESIIEALMKAQKCFNETPFCDNKEELREKQLLFLQNSQDPVREDMNEDWQNRDRQLVDTLCTFVEAKVMEMVKFAKRIPGFSRLNVEDQAQLLKSSKSESFMIGGMPIIDPTRGVFSGTNGLHFKLEDFERVLPKKFFEGKVQIAKKLEKLHLSERETAILRALVITFPDRCPLADKQSVQHIHNVIFECLLYEIEENYVDIDEHVSGIFDLLNFMIDVAPDSILLHRMFEQHGSYASSQLISEFIDPCSMKTL